MNLLTLIKESTMGFIGTLSSMFLLLCAIPAVIDTMNKGHCNMNVWFVRLWFSGEVLGLAYVCSINSWPLILNYGMNSIFTGYLLLKCK